MTLLDCCRMTIPIHVAIGQRFGRLSVLAVVPGTKHGAKRSCVCRCDCGTEKTVAAGDLLSGRTTSCGCWMRESGRTRKLKDITGRTFGRLTAFERMPGTSADGAVWLCLCECGSSTEVSTHKLLSGNTKSCGCLKVDRARHLRLLDVTGQRFGKLVALSPNGDDGHHHTVWLCQCDCGKTTRTSVAQLQKGGTRSCGCLHGETLVARNTTHGATYTVEYIAFHSAKYRCENPRHKSYKDYGGRGIKFLFTSFEQFFKELGPKPAPELSVDRFPNPDGHYEPGNVRWANAKQQAANRRPAKKAA
jgi:hypothetical protein